MKVRPKLLPPTTRGKIAAIYGYIIIVLSLFLAVSYAMGPGDSCLASNKAELTRDSLIISLIHLLVAGGLLLLIHGLHKHPGMLYWLTIITLTGIVLAAELVFAMGFGFAVGTACTT